MNVQEMHIGISLGLDKVSSNAFDNFLEEEKNYYLNKAVNEFIRRKVIYLKENLENASREDFIAEQDSAYDLSTLLVNHSYSNNDISIYNSYNNAKSASLDDLSNPMFSFVYGEVKTSSGADPRACKLISSSDISVYSKTEYNDVVFRKYPVVIIGSNIVIFYDAEGGDVYSFNLLYVKEPSSLVVSDPSEGEVTTCELPTHTHDEIVNLAVSFMAEDIKSARPYEQNQQTTKPDN